MPGASRTASAASTRPSVPGTTGTPAAIIVRRAHHLVAEQLDGIRLRADELDAGRGARFGEFRALAQESVAGVHRIDARA